MNVHTTTSSANTRPMTWPALVLMIVCGMAQAAMPVRSGHAGHWYATDRSGEGWVLELRGPDSAWLYWFTYDSQGRQRWLTATGQIVPDGDDGQRIDFAQLVVTRGARFGAAFDPDDVIREAVGSASLRFSSCDRGQFSYNAFNQSQTFDVQRLARVMGTRCETPHGVTGREVADHAGQSGSWYDPTHNGEGYALHWATPDQAIVTWYSYDAQGNQYWMLGTGQLDAQGRIHFPDVHATRGARFGTAFDPDDVERFAWGTLTFELACDGGSARYESVLPAFGSGDFDLTRLTSLHEVACPWQRPTLTDLYDFSVTTLPIAEGTPLAPNDIQAYKVTDDGKVFALRTALDGHGYHLLKIEPGATDWEDISGNPLISSTFATDPKGTFAVASEWRTQSTSQVRLYRWDGTNGNWLPLDQQMNFEFLTMTGWSQSGQHVAGHGRLPGSTAPLPWLWSSETGQIALETNDLVRDGLPRAVSNDGRVVVGRSLRPEGTMMRPHATRWIDGANPEILRDTYGAELGVATRCNTDCSVIFGHDQAILDNTHPHYRQAWYWKTPGVAAYLGGFDDVFPHLFSAAYILNDLASDGNLAAGAYTQLLREDGDTVFVRDEGFVWTQNTGIVSMEPILTELGIQLWTARAVTSVSSDGRFILLAGWIETQALNHWKAIVLKAEPKHWR